MMLVASYSVGENCCSISAQKIAKTYFVKFLYRLRQLRNCTHFTQMQIGHFQVPSSKFPPRSKDFFFTSCGSLIPFTRANAQWVIHGFNQHLNLHFRVNSLFHHFQVPLCLYFKASLSAKPFLCLNDLDFHGNEITYRTHFHMQCFVLKVIP